MICLERSKREFRIVSKIGRDSKTGYLWQVKIMNQAFDESQKILNHAQYKHLADQVKELARHNEPTNSDTLDIKPYENFYELRDKGGILGKINVRIYFCLDKESRSIVLLQVMKKENERSIAKGDKITIRRRMRQYFAMIKD